MSIISPMAEIPPEILGEIFRTRFPDCIAIPSEDFDALWSLAQTSAQWRSVILDIKSLWKTVSMEFHKHPLSEHPQMIARANSFLRRSKDAPISIRLSDMLHHNMPRLINPVSDFLIPHVHRIRTLNLETTVTLILPLLSLPAGSLPSLQEISIDITDTSWITPLPRGIEAFDGAPEFRVASLRSRSVFGMKEINFPWWQLHELSIREELITLKESYDILKQCISLQSCTLTLEVDGLDTQFQSLEFVVMRRLVKLQLQTAQPGVYEKRLLPLVAPILEELRVTSMYWSAINITSFLGRSGCNLVRLMVVDLLPAALDEVLEQTPLLEELDIISRQGLTPSLIWKISHGGICRVLRLIRCTVTPAMYDEFLVMLATRAMSSGGDSPSKILDVTMSLCGFRFREWGRINYLRSKGLTITVHDDPGIDE